MTVVKEHFSMYLNLLSNFHDSEGVVLLPIETGVQTKIILKVYPTSYQQDSFKKQ